MNVGVREYCKFLEHDIGEIGTSKINLNKNHGNLHFSIPLYVTDLEVGGLNLGLNLSITNILELHDFGRGFKLNYYQKYNSHKIIDSYGAEDQYVEGEWNQSTGMKMIPFGANEGYYRFEDLNGVIYEYDWYNTTMNFDYPDTIIIPNESNIYLSRDNDNINIKRVEIAKLKLTNKKVTSIEI